MGNGYIKPSDNARDVPVRRFAVELAGYKTLEAGQQLRYELVRGIDGKVCAGALRLLR
jgi:cold shock CspA family protein